MSSILKLFISITHKDTFQLVQSKLTKRKVTSFIFTNKMCYFDAFLELVLIGTPARIYISNLYNIFKVKV
jgi:hypothetical protein